jgi:hypothetical protein
VQGRVATRDFGSPPRRGRGRGRSIDACTQTASGPAEEENDGKEEDRWLGWDSGGAHQLWSAGRAAVLGHKFNRSNSAHASGVWSVAAAAVLPVRFADDPEIWRNLVLSSLSFLVH